MANNRNCYQQQHNVSIPRDAIKNIADDVVLKKTDYKVLLVLLTMLDGWTPPSKGSNYKDPLNFKIIDIDAISDFLDIPYKDVKKSIRKLIEYDYLEQGESESVSNGYRFKF